MTHELKARLRAWLVGIVRQAIRMETEERKFGENHGILGQRDGSAIYRNTFAVASNPSTAPLSIQELSFEQMESKALKEQENYYDPQRLHRV